MDERLTLLFGRQAVERRKLRDGTTSDGEIEAIFRARVQGVEGEGKGERLGMF